MASDVDGLALLGSINAFTKGKQMKTTPWYDMSIEPVRDGVYELIGKKSRVIFYARFWRGFWRNSSGAHSLASIQEHHSVGVMLGLFSGWRGLSEKPE